MWIDIYLRDLMEELGAHAPRDKSRVKGYCECGNEVTQMEDVCSSCEMDIIWWGSSIWSRLFESPGKRVARLTIQEPEDRAGKYLMRRAGMRGFANQTEFKRWEKAVRNISEPDLHDIIRYCARVNRGRGIIDHVLNTTDKRIREMPKRRSKAKIKAENEAGIRLPKRRMVDE